MSKKDVESLLIAGGENEQIRIQYDALKTQEDFLEVAKASGYDFTIDELNAVINESGDSFDLVGNPAKRGIWWR